MIPSVFCIATVLVKLISKATSSLFRHPILENNGMMRVTFDFFTLIKLRALSLASEEVVCSDNISPCLELVDYIKNGRSLSFRSIFQTP